MKQYAITVEPGLMKQVDEVVKVFGLYHSRNDFIRDAIRNRLLDLQERAEFRKNLEKFKARAKARGAKLRFLTPEEKDSIAKELLKEKGLL